MLPGILALSERARYLSFYSFLVRRYEDLRRTPSNRSLLNYVRARDYEYAVAVRLCPNHCGSSPVGATRAGQALAEDSGGALTFDASAAFKALAGQAKFYVWPAEKRPPNGKLHVKAAIAYEHAALVTSANLTGAALAENMELGLLVRGGSVPRRLSRHFMGLMDDGTLREETPGDA